MLNLYPESMGMTTTPPCIPIASRANITAKNLATAFILLFILIVFTKVMLLVFTLFYFVVRKIAAKK